MDDDLITIPTELERADEFIVIASGTGGVLVCWWAMQQGVPFLVVVTLMFTVLAWMLTSRAAMEVRIVGAVAVLIRSRLGERAGYEWVAVFLRHVWLVLVPIWRHACAQLLKSALRRASNLRRRLSAATP